MRRLTMTGLALFVALSLAACAGAPATTTTQQEAKAAPAATLGALTISDPWVRPASPAAPAMAMPDATATPGHSMGGSMEMGAGTTSASYMTIANSGSEPDALIAATTATDLVEAVELHTMIEEGGVMKMRPVEKIEVPANGEVMLKPGSFHVMFIGVKQELKPGDVVKLSLTFEKAGQVEVDAVVRAPDAMP